MATLDIPRLSAPAGGALLALCVLAFAALAADLRWSGPVTRADVGISSWFHSHTQPAFTAVMRAVSALHGTLAICLMVLCAAAWLAWRRRSAWLSLLVLCVPGGLLLNASVKHVFERARPAFDPPVTYLASYSFPSGHTAGATLWWGFALLWWFSFEPRRARRAAAAALAAAMVLLTALSRIYLGMHYPSDVLAAVVEGVAWLVLCVAAARALERARDARERGR
jgi:undecaprenyl-diphosphatase